MVEAEVSSPAIMISACRACGRDILSDLTNTQTGMAQAYQHLPPLAEHTEYAGQPARNWGLWDTIDPEQHIMEVDQMLETDSTHWPPPERHEADIARFHMDIDAIQAPTVRTNMAIDPQLLDASNMSFAPVQVTAERAQSYMPPAVGLEPLAYSVVVAQLNPIGDYRVMEQHTVMDTDITEPSTRGFHELEPALPEQIQQSYAVSTSGPDQRRATVHKCPECDAEFARRDGLR
jgi:hypothetical protein